MTVPRMTVPRHTDIPVLLLDRVPQVLEMAKSDKAKVQYFQLYCMFDEFEE